MTIYTWVGANGTDVSTITGVTVVSGAAEIQSNQIQATTTPCFIEVTGGSADGASQLIIDPNGDASGGLSGLRFRVLDSDNYWSCFYSASSETVFLYKVVAGVFSSQGSYVVGDSSESYIVDVEYTGSNITMSVEGVKRVSVVDSEFSANSTVGLRIANTTHRIGTLDTDSTPVVLEVLGGLGVDIPREGAGSGGSASPGRDFYSTENAITKAGTVTRLDIKTESASTGLKFKSFRDNAGTFEFQGSSPLLNAAVNGMNRGLTFTGIPVLVGDIPCVFIEDGSPTLKVSTITSNTPPANSLWSGGASDQQTDVSAASLSDFNPGLLYEIIGTPSSPDFLQISQVNYTPKQTTGATTPFTLSGVYSAASVSAIEYELNSSGSWIVGEASPVGGVFSFNIDLPVGNFDIVIRFQSDTGITDSILGVTIGDIFPTIGQSNISGRGTLNQAFVNSPVNGYYATMLGNDDVLKVAVDPYDDDTNQVDLISEDTQTDKGSWIPIFSSDVMASTETPVILIPCPKGSTSIAEWQKTSTDRISGLNLYESMSRRIALVGDIKVILFEQGESDVGQDTPKATYKTLLNQLIDDLFADFGVDTFIIPLHIYTVVDAQQLADIQAAQVEVAAENSHARIGTPITYDIAVGAPDDLGQNDGIHFKTNGSLDAVGTAMAVSYLGSQTNAAISITQEKPVFSLSAIVISPNNAAIDFTLAKPVFSISAGSVAPTSAAIDINISEPVFSIFASDGTTVYYYSKGTQVRLF